MCRPHYANDSITPTGIPPHIGIMASLDDCKGDVLSIREGVRSDVEEAIKRHVHGSIMTMEALESAFAAALERSVIQNGLSISRSTVMSVGEPETSSPFVSQPELFTWNGSFHRVPCDFVLPNGTLNSMWQRWCIGSPALRHLTKHDMPTRVMKVRLAEFRRLMTSIEELIPQDQMAHAYKSVELATATLFAIKGRLALSKSTRRG